MCRTKDVCNGKDVGAGADAWWQCFCCTLKLSLLRFNCCEASTAVQVDTVELLLLVQPEMATDDTDAGDDDAESDKLHLS